MLDVRPEGRDRRIVSAILVLAAIALFFIVVGQIGTAFFFFGDVLLTFFLAWLLAFIISPIVAGFVDLIPRLPRCGGDGPRLLARGRSTRLCRRRGGRCACLVGQRFRGQAPRHQGQSPARSSRRGRRGSIRSGLNQVDLQEQAETALANLDQIFAGLVAPLQSIAVASLGVLGTMLIVFFLSIYMVLDRDKILAFLFRLVPPSYSDEARLLQTSVSRSFGGFPPRPGTDGPRLLHDRVRNQRDPWSAAGSSSPRWRRVCSR